MSADAEEYLLSLASRCVRRMMEVDEGLAAAAGQQGMAEVFGAADALVAVAAIDQDTAERIKASVMRQVHDRLLALGLADPVEVALGVSAHVEAEEEPGEVAGPT